jgi:hypothetical protein
LNWLLVFLTWIWYLVDLEQNHKLMKLKNKSELPGAKIASFSAVGIQLFEG